MRQDLRSKQSDKIRINIPLVAKHKRYQYLEVCESAGITYRSLRMFLDGDTSMGIDGVERVCAALDMTIQGMINWKAS